MSERDCFAGENYTGSLMYHNDLSAGIMVLIRPITEYTVLYVTKPQ